MDFLHVDEAWPGFIRFCLNLSSWPWWYYPLDTLFLLFGRLNFNSNLFRTHNGCSLGRLVWVVAALLTNWYAFNRCLIINQSLIKMWIKCIYSIYFSYLLFVCINDRFWFGNGCLTFLCWSTICLLAAACIKYFLRTSIHLHLCHVLRFNFSCVLFYFLVFLKTAFGEIFFVFFFFFFEDDRWNVWIVI